MAITTLDGYIGAVRQRLTWMKTGTRTLIAAMPYTTFDIAGNPGAGTLNVGNTANGLVHTDATAGYPLIASFGGSSGYLSKVEFGSSVACCFDLFDRLFVAGAYAYNADVTLASQPDFSGRVPNANYNGLQLWVEQVTVGTGIQHVQVNYLDQDGQAGDTAFVKVLKTLKTSISGSSVVSAFAKILKTLKVSISGVTSVSGIIERIYHLSGQVIGTATVNGFTKIIKSLKVTVSGVASIIASLTITLSGVIQYLAGIVQGIASVSGFAKVTHKLSATINGIASTNGMINVFRGLKATIFGITSVTGMISKLYSLSGQILGNSIVNGFVSVNRYLKAVSNGIAQISGTLNLVWLSVMIIGTSTVNGFLRNFGYIPLRLPVSELGMQRSLVSKLKMRKILASGLKNRREVCR